MRITLATLGSFGDLHPFLAIGLGLKARGHDVTLASCPIYKSKVEAAGLRFAPLRPDAPSPEKASELAERVMDARKGTRAVMDEWTMPALRDTYADLAAACAGADLLISHTIVFPGPLLAEKTGLPFLSVVLQPIVFFSVHDPCIPPTTPRWQGFAKLPKSLVRLAYKLGWQLTRPWLRPVDALRTELGLPPSKKHPLIEGQFSPLGTLALFSSALGAAQPDWPQSTVQTGFAFYDSLEGKDAALSPELEAFLAAGEPPIVFTLGSSAVMTAGNFFEEAVKATKALNARAVLLTGRGQPVPPNLPPSILAVPYAPHSLLMPRAAVNVHQGGVGTTGQALRAGKPQVIVPFAHDQPDHAARITRAGLGRTVYRDACTAQTLAATLQPLLTDIMLQERCRRVGEQLQQEDGIARACEAIEQFVALVK
ncbi:MAG: glycosyltransferase [Armatimonadetes bacterium]|jgi:rhamnosyltransferase subunit B|nr:glycosyltransferase [Armatimonadota bacterium]